MSRRGASIAPISKETRTCVTTFKKLSWNSSFASNIWHIDTNAAITPDTALIAALITILIGVRAEFSQSSESSLRSVKRSWDICST